MSNSEIELALYHNVSQLATLYRQRLTKLAEPFHLTGAQLHALLSLTPGQASPMKDLCVFLSCDASYITNIIERLVSMGLIERHEAATDRRIKMISLTKKGEQLRKMVTAQFPDQCPTTILSNEEKQTFLNLLQKMLSEKQ